MPNEILRKQEELKLELVRDWARITESSIHDYWKRSVFILIPKKGNAKECSDYHTVALISHASKVRLKILQARLQ